MGSSAPGEDKEAVINYLKKRQVLFNITIQILPLLFVCFVLPGCRQANPAEVEKVIDGDSFRLKGGQEVRIIGIDAPEYGGKSSFTERK